MPDAALLNSGKAEAVSLGTGVIHTLDILCEGKDTLQIMARMSGAADADLGVEVRPVEADGSTVMPLEIPPVNEVGPTHAGGVVNHTASYDVAAYDRVQLRVVNNNAGTQTLNRLSWKVQ